MASEFEKYARGTRGVSSLKLHDFQSIAASYVSPTIIEERQLNVATMDVFSRLMMDRIIFLGAPIYDDAANIIQAQLLFLESVDPEKDIQIYINSPGGVSAPPRDTGRPPFGEPPRGPLRPIRGAKVRK